MTKSDLIDTLSKKEKLTEKQATEILNLIFDGFTDSLKEGDGIEIRGFGSFKVKERNARNGRNPKTGITVDIPKKKTIFFKPGKELKKKVDYYIN